MEAEEKEQQELGESKLAEYGHGYRTAPQAASSFAARSPREDQGFTPAEICSDEQIEILKLVEGGKNVFITGSAGVGKSLVLSE